MAKCRSELVRTVIHDASHAVHVARCLRLGVCAAEGCSRSDVDCRYQVRLLDGWAMSFWCTTWIAYVVISGSVLRSREWEMGTTVPRRPRNKAPGRPELCPWAELYKPRTVWTIGQLWKRFAMSLPKAFLDGWWLPRHGQRLSRARVFFGARISSHPKRHYSLFERRETHGTSSLHRSA